MIVYKVSIISKCETPAFGFLEVVYTSQTSKTNSKGDTGYKRINDPI